jgi:transcriptional regulator with XRE-family HTH domain
MANKKQRPKSKPFPWTCPACGHRTVVNSECTYPVEGRHDNKSYSFTIVNLHAPKCMDCGEVVFDRETHEQISQAIRDQIGLLGPREILHGIQELGLNQKDLAEGIGVSEETLSRWVTGSIIQSCNNDKRLRRFFASYEQIDESPEVQHISHISISPQELAELWTRNLAAAQPAQEIIAVSGSIWGFKQIDEFSELEVA